jgi:hypothetical protein
LKLDVVQIITSLAMHHGVEETKTLANPVPTLALSGLRMEPKTTV